MSLNMFALLQVLDIQNSKIFFLSIHFPNILILP